MGIIFGGFWLYHNSRKTGASEMDISSISIEVEGGCVRRLAERIPTEHTKDWNFTE